MVNQVAPKCVHEIEIEDVFVDSTRNHTLTVKTHGKSNDSSK